ncbi:NAD(P)-binding protein [Sarocladium strictum]
MSRPEDIISITAAAGHQGNYIIPRLYGKVPLRLVANSETSEQNFKSKWPNAEVINANMLHPLDCARIVQGAAAVYTVGPGIRAGEKEMGLNMVNAAIDEANSPGSHFRHFVYGSVLNTQLRKMFNHDDKRYVEEALILSLLNYTILQPGNYLEVALPAKEWLLMDRPWRPTINAQEARSSFVSLKDYGDVAAKVLLEREAHYSALYPLVSVPEITYGEATRQIGVAIGKEIEIRDVSFDEAVDFLLDMIFSGKQNAPPEAWDKAAYLVLHYKKRGIRGNPAVLEWLLGRKPTTLAEYFQDQKDEIARS